MAGDDRVWHRTVIAVPTLWLICLVALPYLVLLKLSLAAASVAGDAPWWHASLDAFRLLAQDAQYAAAYLGSLRMASITALGCLLLGLPLALAIARSTARWRGYLLLAVLLPFCTSSLLRLYGWSGMLADEGPVNAILSFLRVSDNTQGLANTQGGLVLGMISIYLPLMVLPIYANLARQDPCLLEVAKDLGTTALQRFARITLPLALPGILAGAMWVFIPALGEFVAPTLLGGSDGAMIGRVLWDEFFTDRDGPVAAALALVLMALLVLPLMLLQVSLAARRGAMV